MQVRAVEHKQDKSQAQKQAQAESKPAATEQPRAAAAVAGV